jgi:type IV pilus assembly protein PilN
MAKINLLPWREELRAERKVEFLTALGVVTALAILTLMAMDQLTRSDINQQQARNQYLQQNIVQLDQQVAEIRNLQKRRSQLIDRMRVIQELQGNRPIIVRVMDQLVRTVPDGVFYTQLTTRGGKIAIKGVAESNNRVSSLMRQLDASDWLEEPNLDAVRAAPEYGLQATTFNLTIAIQLPEPDEEG